MKLKLQFIIAAFIALVVYVPVAHGQANLTFSGGNGTPLTTTLTRSVTYTIPRTNSNCFFKTGFNPYFNFDEVGNPVPSNPAVTGTISYSINGGVLRPIDFERSGYVLSLIHI